MRNSPYRRWHAIITSPRNLLQAAVLSASLSVHGQGTFVYDQQSSIEGSYQEGSADIQQTQPMGQSFTPQLSSVGFIRLYVGNGILGNTSPATLHVNLRSDSITGSLLGSSAPFLIPEGALFAAPVTLLFSNSIPVTPGLTYYFQPVVSNNNNLMLSWGPYNYPGGTAFFGGAPDPSNGDLWFREGIVVPEPASAALLLIGALALAAARATRTRTRR